MSSLIEVFDVLYQVSLKEEMKLVSSMKFPREKVIDEYFTTVSDEEQLKKISLMGACCNTLIYRSIYY